MWDLIRLIQKWIKKKRVATKPRRGSRGETKGGLLDCLPFLFIGKAAEVHKMQFFTCTSSHTAKFGPNRCV